MIGVSYLTGVFFITRSFNDTLNFDLVTLTVSFNQLYIAPHALHDFVSFVVPVHLYDSVFHALLLLAPHALCGTLDILCLCVRSICVYSACVTSVFSVFVRLCRSISMCIFCVCLII